MDGFRVLAFRVKRVRVKDFKSGVLFRVLRLRVQGGPDPHVSANSETSRFHPCFRI